MSYTDKEKKRKEKKKGKTTTTKNNNNNKKQQQHLVINERQPANLLNLLSLSEGVTCFRTL